MDFVKEIQDIVRNHLKENNIIVDEMKEATIKDLAECALSAVKDELKAAVLSDPSISSRLGLLHATVAGQIDALQAHFIKTKDELIEDATKVAKKDLTKHVLDTVEKMAKDIEEIREEVKEEIKNEIRTGLMDELRAELREEF
ncbi:uncharacterized protein K444DRAFT_670255 [Hyaloscypha bicolor E]|uniref:Uncharacterized protein n=1 Tax=Hyaloscypha bicolor E TaxID=1095630 RepID=A0A2J6SIH2_9HELO|nr:uncharacterized protein K444DRAFT_670255 [Hyaloscypha bicolor E]PMD50564.1 hypothetical protein K444DRAFT_670255 [Hyaloscypha bicolor E]